LLQINIANLNKVREVNGLPFEEPPALRRGEPDTPPSDSLRSSSGESSTG